MNETEVRVAAGRYAIPVVEHGEGPPLLFLHGVTGLQWGEALDALAQHHRVIAPRTPGYGDESQGELDTVHDLVYGYLDLLDALGLQDVPMVGHSLGGMIAAELAATQPARFSRLVLAAPLGMFHADRPTFDFFACTPKEQAAAFYKDPEGEAARSAGDSGLLRLRDAGTESEEGQELVQVYIERMKTFATAAKYLWPIPNRGLWKRIHRITTPTLVLWGDSDKVVPHSYAEDFTDAIPGARCELVPDASHELLAEQPARVAELIEGFVRG